MTFDGPNKLLILSSVTLDLIAAWSAYKDWLLAGNAGYALAFDTVGGEPINPVSGTLVPLFLFQKNGWKVRPMEANHTLEVINGMLIGEGGGDPFVPTLGSYNVKVKLIEPVQAIGYSTTGGGSGPSASDIVAALLAALNATTIPVDMQKTNGHEIIGDGSSGDKFRSINYVG